MANIKQRGSLWIMRKVWYVKSTRPWLWLTYFYFSTLFSLGSESNKQKAIERPKTLNNKLKAVLIYSRAHFDPKNDSSSRPYAHGSAGNIARNLYQTLEQSHHVIYVDQNEMMLPIKDADIIIGTASKIFLNYCNANPNAQKFVFLVNSHPLFQLKTLLSQSTSFTIPLYEFNSPKIVQSCIQISDKALLIGNDFVKNTFTPYVRDANKIHLINCGVNSDILVPDESRLPKDKFRILFTATHLGLRKGIYRLFATWDALATMPEYANCELYLIGKKNELYANEIDNFLKRHNNVVVTGWVDSTSQEYKQLLQSGHAVMGLSLEEGQVGSILETMSTGAVPIVTPNCGIGINDKTEGFIISANDNDDISAEVATYIRELFQNKERTMIMRKNVRAYIETHHSWQEFQAEIKKCLIEN